MIFQFFFQKIQNEIFEILKMFKNNIKLTTVDFWINS